jgi:hypothetical protein
MLSKSLVPARLILSIGTLVSKIPTPSCFVSALGTRHCVCVALTIQDEFRTSAQISPKLSNLGKGLDICDTLPIIIHSMHRVPLSSPL